jgi:hypothetical protein
MRSVVTTLTPELAAVDATIDVEHVEAFSEGTVGWFVGRLEYTDAYPLHRGWLLVVHFRRRTHLW